MWATERRCCFGFFEMRPLACRNRTKRCDSTSSTFDVQKHQNNVKLVHRLSDLTEAHADISRVSLTHDSDFNQTFPISLDLVT